MAEWEQIWRGNGAPSIWSEPDPGVRATLKRWSATGEVARVLDLGCGVGRHLRSMVDLGYEAHGIDSSESAIAACAERFPAEVRIGEMTATGYPDAFFDAVVAFNSVHHGGRDDVTAAVAEIARILRPGGWVFATLASRENRMFGKGEPAGENAFRSAPMFPGMFDSGGEAGVAHYFSSEADVNSFFAEFRFRQLEHSELELCFPRPDGELRWTRVPRSFFWKIEAVR